MGPLAFDGEPLEVACDESGWEGENHVGSNTDVFAHAAVCTPMAVAARAVLEVRDRIGSPASEYKANHLLRTRHRRVLEWTLGPDGPLYGRASVHLVDKAYLVVRSLAEVLLDGDADAALVLYGDGPRAFGPRPWHQLLATSNALLRMRNDGGPAEPVDAFLAATAALPDASGRLREVVDMLGRSAPRARAYREGLEHEPGRMPILDPLGPAVVRAARQWATSGRAVEVVHDRQNTLTPERIEQIVAMFDARPEPCTRLLSVRLVASTDDSRVQIADFLAGIARKVASDQLDGRGDPALTGLLRPYVDPHSVWADEPSWAALRPDGTRPAARPAAGPGLRQAHP